MSRKEKDTERQRKERGTERQGGEWEKKNWFLIEINGREATIKILKKAGKKTEVGVMSGHGI